MASLGVRDHAQGLVAVGDYPHFCRYAGIDTVMASAEKRKIVLLQPTWVSA